VALDDGLIEAALPLYEVEGELSRGAWGVVFGARHRQLGREVAIKELPRTFGADPAVRARFVAEARVLASLDHSHIVPIYDFVERDGLCLLVMERLTGGTVASRFEARAFTPQSSCAVGLATCAALHYAHQHGVLHRDIKPDNLMFSSQNVLKVTDFGLAKVIGGSATVATRAGDVLGTPAYMAPEQAQGEVLGPATDIYALGTVLYVLLAGRLPFPEDANPLTMLYRHVHEQPTPLVDAATHIPPEIAAVVSRALATNPADRHPDAETFAVSLAEAAAGSWGPGWLGDSGITVVATGTVLSAAVSRGRTHAAPIAHQPSGHGPAEAVPTAPAASAETAAPGDLVPVNRLQRDFLEPAPPPPTAAPPTAAPPTAAPPRTPPPAPLSPAPAPPEPTAGSGRRGWLIAAVAAVVVVAVVGALLAFGGGSDSGSKKVATNAAPLQPIGSWRTLQDVPTARQQLGASVVNGVIWVVGGLTDNASTPKVEGYDPAVDAWKTGPDLPLPLHHEMVVTYHNELIALGGWVPDGPALTATVSDKVFALRNGAWVELPHLLHPRAAGAAAVVGDQIVVFGGQANAKLVPTAEVFDGKKWSETERLPVPRDHLAGASDGHFVYAVGGRDLSSDKNLGAVDRYDPAARHWTKLPDLRTPRGDLGAAVVGGRLLTAGGESPTSVFDTVELLDLKTNAWSSGPAMHTPRHGMAMVGLGSTVYALAGARAPSHTASSGVAEALDFSSSVPSPATPGAAQSAWRTLHDLPTARQQLGAAVADGVIWVAGGLTQGTSTPKVEGYDPAIDTWKSAPDLPLPVHHEMVVNYHGELVVLGGWVPNGPELAGMPQDKVFALRNGAWVELPPMLHPRAAGAAAVVGDQLVVFGGQNQSGLIPDVEVFDGTTWSETAPLPTPRDHLAGASDGHFVYAVSGRQLSSDKEQGAVERYDPVSRSWAKLPDVPTPRDGLAAAVVNGKLVAVGGENLTSVFDNVEIFDIAANTWSEGPPIRTPRHGLAVVSLGSTVYAMAGALAPSHVASSPLAEASNF
jgi:N-acetylneuraminic acid mutarotase